MDFDWSNLFNNAAQAGGNTQNFQAPQGAGMLGGQSQMQNMAPPTQMQTFSMPGQQGGIGQNAYGNNGFANVMSTNQLVGLLGGAASLVNADTQKKRQQLMLQQLISVMGNRNG